MTIVIRPCSVDDLPEADRIFRLAFGTFIGLADPMQFAGDSDWIGTAWRRDPKAAFVAEVEGEVAGSNFATDWGSLGFFGPLTVRPDLWDRGIARRLLEPVMECFAHWGTRHAGLFTFAQSPKHIGLYGGFGFHPRFLTAILAKPARAGGSADWTRFSEVPAHERDQYVAACRELTDSIFAGLDLTGEIETVARESYGDTLLVWEQSRLAGMAVCHVGAGTQGGSGTCYVKFGAARGATQFERLLDAVDAYALSRDSAVAAGVNLGRVDAYKRMLGRGFRTVIQGVAMHRPNVDAYERPDAYALDDWR